MRRTLTVLAATAALLVPAGIAVAVAPDGQGPGFNASCNNGKGGNYEKTGDKYNGKGNSGKAKDCKVPDEDGTPTSTPTTTPPTTPTTPPTETPVEGEG